MDLERIKAIPILEIAQHLGLNVKGRSAHCFSHAPDRHPSLVFNLKKNSFKCYVCPELYGSVIDLVMQVRGCPFKDALEELKHYSGLSDRPTLARPMIKRKRKKKRLSSDYKSTIYENLLQIAPLELDGERYLNHRGITTATAQNMGIRFLRPETFRGLYQVMVRIYGKADLHAAGLNHFFGFSENGLPFLLFPYRTEGQCRLIKARCLLSKREADARHVLRFYATDAAGIFYNHDAIRASQHLYLCEGEMDTLSLTQRGYAAIGIPGVSSFRKEWLPLLKDKHLVLCLDNDPAGTEATEGFYKVLNQHNISFSRFALPPGMDVNAYYLEQEVSFG